jgi:hypothetical protein
MGRKRINFEEFMIRSSAGTAKRIDSVLQADEKQAEFLREAVERELRRREPKKKPAPEGTG